VLPLVSALRLLAFGKKLYSFYVWPRLSTRVPSVLEMEINKGTPYFVKIDLL